jgi:hypothetical protein
MRALTSISSTGVGWLASMGPEDDTGALEMNSGLLYHHFRLALSDHNFIARLFPAPRYTASGQCYWIRHG